MFISVMYTVAISRGLPCSAVTRPLIWAACACAAPARPRSRRGERRSDCNLRRLELDMCTSDGAGNPEVPAQGGPHRTRFGRADAHRDDSDTGHSHRARAEIIRGFPLVGGDGTLG